MMAKEQEHQLIGEYPSLPKQKRALQKRQALLESGRTLFIEKGWEQTNAKEIAAHAHVATGTFYRYFTDKRQLLMSIIEDYVDKIIPPELNWTNNDPISYIAQQLETHDCHFQQLGLQKLLPELLKDQQINEIIKENQTRIHKKIMQKLETAKEQGLSWTDLDSSITAWSIMSLSASIIEINRYQPNKTNYVELAKIICRLIFPPEVLEKLIESNSTSQHTS